LHFRELFNALKKAEDPGSNRNEVSIVFGTRSDENPGGSTNYKMTNSMASSIISQYFIGGKSGEPKDAPLQEYNGILFGWCFLEETAKAKGKDPHAAAAAIDRLTALLPSLKRKYRTLSETEKLELIECGNDISSLEEHLRIIKANY